MAALHKGEQIMVADGSAPIEVVDYIAEGGQGEVYKARYNGQTYALKWYKIPAPSYAFYQNLASNIEKGPPNQHYLWPKQITEIQQHSYGYLMELRPPRYREFGEFLLGYACFKSWGVLLQAAMNIVESFRLLHSRGYSYQDLNEGGFFIDPDNGDVLICDNDNVAPFGVNLGVKGVPRYMAPEVVLNRSYPNTHTDRFSLAVILFRLFYIDHPLEGRFTLEFPLTDVTGARIYGLEPTFIYDPANARNRPHPQVHVNVMRRWNLYPPDLAQTFIRAFTAGLKDIDSRVTELEWLDTLIKVRDMLVVMGGSEQFVNGYRPETLPEGCLLLRLPEHNLVLGAETRLYGCHVDQYSADYTTVRGIARAGLLNKNSLGLGNLSDKVWTLHLPDGSTKELKPNSFIPLAKGMRIDFGGTQGEIT